MTKKEAIKTLRELWRETNDSWYEGVYKMAIEALSEQYMGCHGCRHYDSLQTSVICYDCSRAYKDRYEE